MGDFQLGNGRAVVRTVEAEREVERFRLAELVAPGHGKVRRALGGRENGIRRGATRCA